MTKAVDLRFILHPPHGVSHQIVGPLTAPCRPGATIARLSNVGRKSRQRASRNFGLLSHRQLLSTAPTRPRKPFKATILFAPITVPFLFLAAAIFGRAHRQV